MGFAEAPTALPSLSCHCCTHILHLLVEREHVHVVKHFLMWVSVIWKVLPEVCNSNPAISIIKFMHISLFLMCKYERHFTNTFAQ